MFSFSSQRHISCHVMEALFDKYRNEHRNHFMTAQQSDNLRAWHGRVGRDGIALSQIDNWLLDAQLLPSECSKSESGLVFMEFKSFSLSFDQFMKFIELLSVKINIDSQEVRTRLLNVNHSV